MRFPNALLGTSKAGARVPGSRNVSGVPGLQLQLRSRRRLVAATLLSLAGILVLFHLDDAFTVHFRDLGYITRPVSLSLDLSADRMGRFLHCRRPRTLMASRD